MQLQGSAVSKSLRNTGLDRCNVPFKVGDWQNDNEKTIGKTKSKATYKVFFKINSVSNSTCKYDTLKSIIKEQPDIIL